tara:strand:- start:2352 stop:2711 length:360 start_codon:yes stop_codon:yes gene_type:complete
MPKLDGKEYSYDKAGMSAFNEAKMKKNKMGRMGGGMVKYNAGGMIRDNSGIMQEQDRVMRKFGDGGKLGEEIGKKEKLPKLPKQKLPKLPKLPKESSKGKKAKSKPADVVKAKKGQYKK